MKNRTSQLLYGYWNEVRGDRLAPSRFEIEPSRISEILSETFILERGHGQTYPFRLAGTKICEYFGLELRGRDILDLVLDEDREALEPMLQAVTEQGAVAVLCIEAQDQHARPVTFEVLVMPLLHGEPTVQRYLGSITAIDPPVWLGHEKLEPSGLLQQTTIWPDGRPHAVIERSRRQAPFLPAFANARVVRQNRRQFRILDGGRKDGDRGSVSE